MTQNPCFNNGKDCEKRCVGCKKLCLDYVAWELTHQKEKTDLRNNRNNYYCSSEYFLSKKEKNSRNKKTREILKRASRTSSLPVDFVS